MIIRDLPGFTADSPAGRWNVTVLVAEAEQRHLRAARSTGASGGNTFLTAYLRVYPLRWSTGREVRYVLGGPNIRADGTPGKLHNSLEVTRAEAAAAYPLTWAAAKDMLGKLAGQVSADALTAAAEISQVITGSPS
jgi:hypothetical protein